MAKKQRFENHLRPQGTEVTLVFSSFNHLTRLVARENFIKPKKILLMSVAVKALDHINSVLPTQCIYEVRMILSVNSDYFLLQR
jgi:hypothetical protein